MEMPKNEAKIAFQKRSISFQLKLSEPLFLSSYTTLILNRTMPSHLKGKIEQQ